MWENASFLSSTNTSLYYIHFEITGDPCSLIGSRQCDLLMNRTIFSLNRIFLPAHEKGTLKQNNQKGLKACLK